MSRTTLHVILLGILAASSASCMATVQIGEPEPDPDVVTVDEEKDRGPLGIPPGHLPPPGECRLWFPGRPPGQQPPPGNCEGIQRTAQPGAWVLYRPTREADVVHVRVIDRERAGVVIVIRIYDADRGVYLRSERP